MPSWWRSWRSTGIWACSARPHQKVMRQDQPYPEQQSFLFLKIKKELDATFSGFVAKTVRECISCIFGNLFWCVCKSSKIEFWRHFIEMKSWWKICVVFSGMFSTIVHFQSLCKFYDSQRDICFGKFFLSFPFRFLVWNIFAQIKTCPARARR